LLLLTDDVFEVLATGGDTFLGGDDIDAAIADRIAKSTDANVRLSPKQQPELMERLRAIAERVKIDLSTQAATRIRVEDFELGGARGLEFSMSREELDSLTGPLVDRTFQVCKDALTAAKLTPKDIDHVLLVGGSTRTPFVKQRVEEYFGKRVRDDLDPHEVVALGAAQQAKALTQLRATASEIPVPPPRRATVPDQPSSVSGGANDIGELNRKSTDAGVGTGEPIDLGRVSVVPPEVPLTNPVPNTKKLGSRDRRTTGLGLGPSEPTHPHQPSEVVPPKPDLLQVTDPPSTLTGLGPGRGEPDLPLVLPASAKAGTAALPTSAALRSPLAAAKTSDLSESDDIALPDIVARPASPAASKPTKPNLSGRKQQPTIPDDIGSWGPPVDNALDVELPIVTSSKGAQVDRSVTTKLSAEPPNTAKRSLDLLADLPLVVPRESKGQRSWPNDERPSRAPHTVATSDKTQPLAQAKSPQPTLSDLRPPFPMEDTEDEPTVIRGSAHNSDELGDAADFAAALDDLPAIATTGDKPELPAFVARSQEEPLRRPGRSSSMNDDEIRARYGDLPLIVGGRRMSARGSDPGIEPRLLDVSADISTRTNVVTKMGDELPIRAATEQAAPKSFASTMPPVVPPTGPKMDQVPGSLNTAGPAISSASIPSLDPDDVEPFDEGTVRILRTLHHAEPEPKQASELDWAIPDEATPKSERPLSARPTGKQLAEDELTLPVPDLPPAPMPSAQGKVSPTVNRPFDLAAANVNAARPIAAKSPERIASTLPLPQVPNALQ
ncbi:MAG TPA: Hsp70 family protein, partial [Polyangiaceae bacterium]